MWPNLCDTCVKLADMDQWEPAPTPNSHLDPPKIDLDMSGRQRTGGYAVVGSKKRSLAILRWLAAFDLKSVVSDPMVTIRKRSLSDHRAS